MGIITGKLGNFQSSITSSFSTKFNDLDMKIYLLNTSNRLMAVRGLTLAGIEDKIVRKVAAQNSNVKHAFGHVSRKAFDRVLVFELA